jgi:hypothetical protein
MPLDIATLKQTIKDSVKPDRGAQELTLPAGALQSAAITTLFGQFLNAPTENSQLLITSVTLPLPEDANSITVAGTGENVVFAGMAVTAVFSIQQGEGTVALTATATGPYSFITSFPALKDTIFAQLTFTGSPVFILASYDLSAQVKAGLSFSGTLGVTGPVTDIAWLIGYPDTVALSGTIGVASGLPQIALAAPPSAPVPLGFFTFPAVTLTLCNTPEPPAGGQPAANDAYLGLSAAIAFSAQGKTHQIPLGAQIYGTPMFLFYADVNALLDAGIDAALDELTSLVNGADPGPLIPKSVPISRLLRLSGLILQVDVANRTLRSIRLGVETAEPWPVIDVLTIEQLGLSFRLDDPLGKKNLTLSLSGEFLIGEAKPGLGGALPATSPVATTGAAKGGANAQYR